MTAANVQPGADHFPGYDVTARSGAWDDVTAGVVLARLGPMPPPSFFTEAEEAVARPLLDRLLALDTEPKVPVFEMIDSRLAEGRLEGWRYDDMPAEPDAWRVSLACLDKDSMSELGTEFARADRGEQIELLEAVRTGDRWHGLPAARVWGLWMRYACTAFYSHPWAWNEIGFGGPAYPTGYKHLGGREGWEVQQVDGFDPEPWAQRVEQARRRHQGAPR